MLLDIYTQKKLNLSTCKGWNHHRSGWNSCLDYLKLLHNECGVMVVDSIEKIISQKIQINEPYIGFSHNTISHNDYIKNQYGFYGNFDLNYIVNSEIWKENIKYCLGLFTMCSKTTDFLNQFIQTETVHHITDFCKIKFSMENFLNNKDKRIYMIGHWMRNFSMFYKLNSIYKKTIIIDNLNFFDYNKIINRKDTTMFYEERCSNNAYDNLLSCNLVFLNLFDCTACNTILECIERTTPILINRLFCCEEYLGKDYPFFYDNIDEASEKISNIDCIYDAHNYLKDIKICHKKFVDTIYNSKIYKNICLKI